MAGQPKRPRKPPRPITDADRDRILDLHGQGLSRNEIARQTGRSGETVSKLVAAAGGTFHRAESQRQATEIRTADLAARRSAFAVRLQDEAETELDRLRQPTLYWDWGGKDHEYDEKLVPEPTAADRRSIMATVSVAVDRSLKLVPPKDDAADDARSMVGQLMAGLTAVYREQQAEAPADGSTDAP